MDFGLSRNHRPRIVLIIIFINYQNVMLHAQLYFLFVFEARNLIFLFEVNKVLVLVLVLVRKAISGSAMRKTKTFQIF